MAFHYDEQTEFWPNSDVVGPMRNASFQLDEMPTGYVVRSLVPITLHQRLAQGGAWGMGTGWLIAALGLCLLPQADLARAEWLANVAGVAVLAVLAVVFLFIAGAGFESEYRVDLRAREIRKVVCSSFGRGRVVSRYAFDEIGGVFLDRKHSGSDETRLVFRHRNTATVIPLVSGRPEALLPLMTRLGRDVILRTAEVGPEQSTAPTVASDPAPAAVPTAEQAPAVAPRAVAYAARPGRPARPVRPAAPVAERSRARV
ncbi:MAG: hypothetical protein GC146_05540 [Limimaricola sp.]|uniref:hypothetical protein n=1 Tax=Limimaricola sp. TaxID=2211665 RepID=UPI001D30736D|nr:hypothetical protein [Limimaricola sp.]MBI1416670.1 hypothetical protein [Limimaricola sp.]